MQAFCRISDKPIRMRSQVYEPDIVIVQDTTLLATVNVTSGVKSGGIVLLNTERTAQELGLEGDFKVITVPATKIGMEVLGRPITNTSIMGAFAAASGAISIEAIERNIKSRFRGELGEKNVICAQRAYELIKEQM